MIESCSCTMNVLILSYRYLCSLKYLFFYKLTHKVDIFDRDLEKSSCISRVNKYLLDQKNISLLH